MYNLTISKGNKLIVIGTEYRPLFSFKESNEQQFIFMKKIIIIINAHGFYGGKYLVSPVMRSRRVTLFFY